MRVVTFLEYNVLILPLASSVCMQNDLKVHIGTTMQYLLLSQL